jgi:hypothetical protein
MPGLYRALLRIRDRVEYRRLPYGTSKAASRFRHLLGEALDRRVADGPFRGMHYRVNAVGSVWAPKLLGTYERELHSLVERLPIERYERILNVGSAEGYYSVGLAMRLKNQQRTRVVAYDTDDRARVLAKQLAEDNGVTGLVEVRTLCNHAELNSFDGQRILVLCDIEGGERELLDPVAAPALRSFDMLVEVHDGDGPPEIEDLLRQRFAATHEVEVFEYDGRREPYEGGISMPLDPRWRQHAVQEDRVYGLRWLWLTARA